MQLYNYELLLLYLFLLALRLFDTYCKRPEGVCRVRGVIVERFPALNA